MDVMLCNGMLVRFIIIYGYILLLRNPLFLPIEVTVMGDDPLGTLVKEEMIKRHRTWYERSFHTAFAIHLILA